MPVVFVTGFPGFLGSALLPRILRRDPELEAVCLVQSRYREQAETRAAEIAAENPEVEGRIRLVEGDITKPDLDLGDAAEPLLSDVVEAWHLAAVYDLSVPRDLAMSVNVEGTRNVVDFCRRADGLRRLHYVSTCYVSGRWPGIFRETDLQLGQSFNNFYEETKHLAEVVVREAMDDGLPATIYRPSVVVGDSTTGATQKYDGPYFLIRWLLKQPGKVAVMPTLGFAHAFRFNTVPRDFVLDGVEALSGREETVGGCYALADPDPLTIEELVQTVGRAVGKRLVRVRLPSSLAQWATENVPGVLRLTGIPSSTMDYFTHPTHYDTSLTTEALAPTGVSCPPFPSYVDNLVRFVQEHPEYDSSAMV